MLKLVIAQVRVEGLPTGAGGACVLEVTFTVVEEVQPVVVLVIARVYVPAALTVGVRVFWLAKKLPPTVLHTKVKFGPEEEADASRMICGVTQFNCAGGEMAVVGAGN